MQIASKILEFFIWLILFLFAVLVVPKVLVRLKILANVQSQPLPGFLIRVGSLVIVYFIGRVLMRFLHR